MNRERMLPIALGAALGLAALFQIVNSLLIKPRTEALAAIENAKTERARVEKVLLQENDLRRDWNRIAGRSFSYDGPTIRTMFGLELKRLADKHNLERANFMPRVGPNIYVPKSKDRDPIGTEAYVVSGEGDFSDVTAFLRELYESPYLCQVTKMSVAPMDPKKGRNRVRIDQLIVETPRLSRFTRKEMQEIGIKSDPPTIDQAGQMPDDPARPNPPGEVELARLSERNIFKMYVPPPTYTVAIDNQDRLDVAFTLKSYWEGRELEQLAGSVPGKSRKDSPSFKGDAVEITAIYADGKTTSPQRFDERTRQPWVMTVPKYTKDPPPETIDLAVDNKHTEAVDVVVTVTGKDGKPVVKPTMRFEPGKRADVDVYQANSVLVSATYPSGRQVSTQTYTPRPGKQVFTIPVEQVQVALGNDPPPPPASDAPAAPDLRLTGTQVYGEMHELFATNDKTKERQVVLRGGDVDGGSFIAAHPDGAIVYMPKTGNYYFYPLGRMFVDRVHLDEVGKPEELAAAIRERNGSVKSQ